MTKISLPERGQPLDIKYISSIANEINLLSNAYGQAFSASTMSSVTFYAQEINNIPDGDRVAGSTYDVVVTFGILFSKPPFVFPIIVSRDEKPASKNIIVHVRDIVTSGCTVGLRYNEKGQSSVSLNILAVGETI